MVPYVAEAKAKTAAHDRLASGTSINLSHDQPRSGPPTRQTLVEFVSKPAERPGIARGGQRRADEQLLVHRIA